MKNRATRPALAAALACCAALVWGNSPAWGQDWAKPSIKNLHRLDLRNLGYPLVNEIPAGSSAITSLVTAGDGKIYGGTSGSSAYLFVYDPAINKVRHLGMIGSQQGVHHSLVEGADGCIYIGTGKSIIERISLSIAESPSEHIDTTLWRDIKNVFEDYPGGHLYRYDPAKSNSIVKLVGMDCEVEDLGIPVKNNSIYALAVAPHRTAVYGLTYPDGHFFVYDIRKKKYTDLGPIDERRVFHGPARDVRSLPRALVCDKLGRVFTSSTDGLLKYYQPWSGKLFATKLRVPGDYYHVQFYNDYAVVEYFATAPSGLIYGGTSDGYLFSLDAEKMKLVNLGKPRAARRLRCLTVGTDGKVYMMAGERSASRPCQCYCYDPKTGGFEDMGLLIADRSPHYYWRGYQFDSMTSGRDGTVYIGESERRSHLFLYVP